GPATIAMNIDGGGQQSPPGRSGRRCLFHSCRDRQRRRPARVRGTLSMHRPPEQQRRRRVAGPGVTAAVVAVSIGSLGGLRLWAGEAESAQGPADALGLALLRADLERNPADATLRLRLTRE